MSQAPQNYANATFNKVFLEGSNFSGKDAVTATYVDTKIDNLVNGATESFNTLKELSMALSDGADVAVAVTSQIASLSQNLSYETNTRVAYESANDVNVSIASSNIAALRTSVDTIEGSRLPALDSAVSQLQSDVTSERQDRTEADNYFTSHVTSLESAVDLIRPALDTVIASDASKLPLAGGSMQGDLNMASNHLYIGANWRLEAFGSELHFRYSPDGVNWTTAIPFASA